VLDWLSLYHLIPYLYKMIVWYKVLIVFQLGLILSSFNDLDGCDRMHSNGRPESARKAVAEGPGLRWETHLASAAVYSYGHGY